MDVARTASSSTRENQGSRFGWRQWCVALGFALLAPLVVWVAPATAAPTPAAPIGCGSVITTSVTLTQDLNCVGAGLIIDADHITVDLGGHTITGNDTATGISAAPFPLSSEGVTIQNGTIQHFFAGVYAAGLSGARFVHVRVLDNQNGFFNPSGNDARISIMFSLVAGNVTGLSSGSNTTSYTVVLSTFANNFAGVSTNQVSDDVFVWNDFHDNVYGFSLSQSEPFMITANQIHHNTVGVALDCPTLGIGASVTNNAFFANHVGVLVTDLCAGGHQITNNTFVNNTTAGVSLSSTLPFGVPNPTVISGNAFLSNGSAPDPAYPGANDGIAVAAGIAAANTITVANNLAVRNADYGIEAPGVTDGGGNLGAANGNRAQCLGVVCRTFRGF